jgi:Na+-transporting methylmalonyl-CoA/oxaloacetate decarboxylase gamma subunit
LESEAVFKLPHYGYGIFLLFYFIIIVTMFAVSALVPYISSGDKTSLTAFERLLALDLAIIILGFIFFYLRRSTER